MMLLLLTCCVAALLPSPAIKHRHLAGLGSTGSTGSPEMSDCIKRSTPRTLCSYDSTVEACGCVLLQEAMIECVGRSGKDTACHFSKSRCVCNSIQSRVPHREQTDQDRCEAHSSTFQSCTYDTVVEACGCIDLQELNRKSNLRRRTQTLRKPNFVPAGKS